MDVKRFLGKVTVDDLYDGQIVHSHKIPLRSARFGELGEALPPGLASILAGSGIESLYTHQVEAVESLRGGIDTVIVTSTASGKTLCYNIPVLEALIEDPGSRALYLYPTKALAQDQLRVLKRYKDGGSISIRGRDVRWGYSGAAAKKAARRRQHTSDQSRYASLGDPA